MTAGVVQDRDQADKENPDSEDPWLHEHYFSVGHDALRVITTALLANGRNPPKAILDFPSGSGRVTRHLRAMFPAARIAACDLYQHHIDFCAAKLGAEPILSKENLNELDIGNTWDLIFCGSLLTHLPEPHFRAALQFIARSLGPTGIAVVTLHGRHVEWRERNKHPYMNRDRFEEVRRGYYETGFGYSDYESNFGAVFDQHSHYGVAMTKPSRVLRELEAMFSVTILGYIEHGWDDHQDVVIFGKPGVNQAP